MHARPLSPRLQKYITKHKLDRAFAKQLSLFLLSPRHPSLHTELLEPKYLGIYSFRVTRSYRAIFIYEGNRAIEIVDINNHYE